MLAVCGQCNCSRFSLFPRLTFPFVESVTTSPATGQCWSVKYVLYVLSTHPVQPEASFVGSNVTSMPGSDIDSKTE